MDEKRDESRPAGGYATQRGINYQNRVAAYFAACSLAERIAMPGFPASPIKSVRCETGEPLADILLTFEDETLVFVEVKRALEFGAARLRPVVTHLIEQYLVSKRGTSGGKFPWRRALDPTRDRLFLVTSSDAPERLTHHLGACLFRITPEVTSENLAQIPQNAAEESAFAAFLEVLRDAWKVLLGETAQEPEVLELLSLFRIGVLNVGGKEAGEQDAEGFLRSTALSRTDDPTQCWATLTQIMGRASESRMLMTREVIRRELRLASFSLASTPSYLNDIIALRKYTRLTLNSLDHLAVLKIGRREIRIQRPVTKYLLGEAEQRSLVVIGDPGAGKSGVLHELASRLQDEERDVVFLAADRLDDSLRSELDLRYELAEVLENWSGDKPGLLFIDALDAARGSGALQVLRDLIDRVATTTDSRWRVVASIRVFDLRYSQDLQRIFQQDFGVPRLLSFQDSSFSVRHIKVPRFSADELQQIRAQSSELDLVFSNANPALLELLGIPFNLRLITDMLSQSQPTLDFGDIETQVGLLERYWLSRVILSGSEGNIREAVLTEIVAALVSERKLTIAKARIIATTKEPQFSTLCSDNVIVEQVANLHGRNIIGFSHHLLFDYAVSRLILGSGFEAFLNALAKERDLSLFLRPSIDLFFKEAWLRHRETFWTDLRLFSANAEVPAIAKIIGPSVIPELAKTNEDLAPLVQSLATLNLNDKAIAEQWIVHVVGALMAGVKAFRLEVWSHFCLEITGTSPSLRLAAACQSLIDNIQERRQNGAVNPLNGLTDLNQAAVYLLGRFATGQNREGWIVGRCIANVMDLFAIDPELSAKALRRLISPEEIREHGAQQGHWLARKLPLLFETDPVLAADIFIAFFGYSERSEEKTSMGSSRILAMTSTRRQDYHQAHWQLAQHFRTFLEEHFELCKAIILAAVNNVIETEHTPRTVETAISFLLPDGKHTVLSDYSAIWDSSSVRGEALEIADAYFRELERLVGHPQTFELAKRTTVELLRDAEYAYFLRRVLRVAKHTGPALASVVYPLFCSPTALWSYDLSDKIGDALRTNYVGLDVGERQQVESAIMALPEGEEGDRLEALQHIRGRLLGCIPVELLSLSATSQLVQQMSDAGGPPENRPPYISHGVRVSPYSEEDRMRERGIPVDDEQNAHLRAKSGRLWRFASEFNNSVPSESDVSKIVEDLDEVEHILLGPSEQIHEEVISSAEAQLMAACATVAKMKSFDCSSALGLTVRRILFWGLNSPEPEYQPEYDFQWDKGPSGWGAPVQRIEAAAGIASLLAHSNCIDDELLAHIRRAVTDAVPAVRFQVVTRLVPLHDKDPRSLWSLLRTIVSEEPRTGVLSGALYATLNPLSGKYRPEVINLIQQLLSRTDLAGNGGEAFEWAHRIATGLYIWQGDQAAFELVRPRLDGDSFRPEYADDCLRDIRESLSFSSAVPNATDADIRKRAFSIVEMIIKSVTTRMNYLVYEVSVEERDESWNSKFQVLARLVDYISNQIYFSSGAYDGTNSSKKLDEDVRRQFWEDSRTAIRLLSDVAIPSAAHHLIETLQSFIPYQPAEVFHAIAAVVRSAKSWGYQYESMAVDLLVTVTETYIAEHRMELQRNLQSREELIDILETFVEAGWPSARRLSYRLEEIFR